MTEIAPRFDYGQLDPKVSTIVAEAADKIRSHGRAAAQSVAEIGKELLAVQKVLTDDRRFLAWIDAEFGWSKSTAYNCMNVAKRFPTVGNDLPLVDLKTLYLLAAPSTPDWVREVANKERERGYGLTYTEARALIEDPHAGEIATEIGLEALRDWRNPASVRPEAIADGDTESAEPAPEAQPAEEEPDDTAFVLERVRAAYELVEYYRQWPERDVAGLIDPKKRNGIIRKAKSAGNWLKRLARALESPT